MTRKTLSDQDVDLLRTEAIRQVYEDYAISIVGWGVSAAASVAGCVAALAANPFTGRWAVAVFCFSLATGSLVKCMNSAVARHELKDDVTPRRPSPPPPPPAAGMTSTFDKYI